MRPRLFFILGSLVTFTGLVMTILASIFTLSFIELSLGGGGKTAEHNMDVLLSHFSWWGPSIALASLILGIWLLRQYEFSYKKNFVFVAVGFVLAILAASFVLDKTGLNEVMLQYSPFSVSNSAEQAFYKQFDNFDSFNI